MKIMVRLLTILAFVLSLNTVSFGQTAGELVQSAYQLQTSEDHEGAKKLIDKAVLMSDGQKSGLAWHIRGFVYKDLFSNNRQKEAASKHRDEAIGSFENSLKHDNRNDHLVQNRKALQFLAVSCFNDASDLIKLDYLTELDFAEKLYFQYRDIILDLHPDTSLTEKDIEYFLAMSSAHRKIYESDREANDKHFYASHDYMDKVLELDPKSFKALYSKGVAYYNRGAYNLERLPYVDIYDVMAIQSESMRSIEASLPFMIRAYDVDPSKVEAVRALRIITFNLNKIEESRSYELKENQLEGNTPDRE